jgi:signal transduction histidine kinase/CheY-like chemotaxis protein
MRKPSKATFNTLLFVIAFLLVLIGIIIYTQYYSQQNIKALREANENASSTFEVNNRLQELVYYVESAEIYAREHHKTPKLVSKESIKDTFDIINNHLKVLKKQQENKNLYVSELDDIINLVNSKLTSLNIFIKNDEVSVPQNYNNTQLDQLLAVSINDSLYNKVLVVQQNLESDLKSTFVKTNSYSEKVLRLDTLLAIVFILALAILGTLIIKRLLDQLSLIYKLAQEKERADNSAVVKEQFLANMSHEIRTPINAVVGFANLLQKTTLDSDQKQFVNLIQNSGENLLSVVNDILDISKIEAGMMRITNNPFNMLDVCKAIEMMFKHKVIEKQLRFDFEFDKNIPETLIGDPERLNQVLINLLNNAIKFTENGYVKLSVKLVLTVTNKSTIQFIVKDSGIGISKEKLETVFERFEQADNNTARQYGGTGLGLAIVEKIISLQDGNIKVDSKLGEGTSFTVLLNYEMVNINEKSTSNIISSTNINGAKKQFSNFKILVAEDNKTNQTLLKFILLQWNLAYDLAENGQQVLDKLNEDKYDLVLMDIQMPVMDGYESAKKIREELKTNIPIIAMTAHVLPTEKQKCIDAGMDDYISKPIDETIFINMLEKYLGKATVKQTNNLDSTKTNSLQYVDYDYLKNVFSNNFDFINEILNQFKDQYPSELSELKKAVNEKNKENVLKLSHHIKTTVTTLSTHTPIRQQLENIDNYVAKDNWVFVNDNLNKMLLSEPILMNEIETIIKKEKIA